MVFELLKLNVEMADDDFNSIYPERIRVLAYKHWTPVSVARISSEFLVDRPGTRVLDIGSGVGKFCLVGAVNTKGHFTGVEQRPELVRISQELSTSFRIRNIKFIDANITSIKFNDYDAFYFFNPFFENVDMHNRIDDTVKLDVQLYDAFSVAINLNMRLS
ncbi:MAG TPA: methyltransferase domain-containing protein [Cyclobacteriaceae bacterium]|nr:methyltransferase domain-containing protein [Cyclobacteriaceae bacterium]